jgi:hypothetical protein
MNLSYSSVDLKKREQPVGTPKYIYILGIIAVLGIVGFFIFTQNQGKTGDNASVTPTPSQTVVPTPTEDPYRTFEEETVTADGHYFEKLPLIEGQQAYIAYPKTILKAAPPTIVVYSHGSITTITKNMNDEFMQDMRSYGEFFTENGYIFAASAMHGQNWGNAASVADMKAMVQWIKENYPAQEKVNLVAHSMGGLPTWRFAFENPTLVNKIALLAPTSNYETYKKANYDAIKTIPIRIWHGNKDVNVPYSVSTTMLARAKANGVQNIELVTLQGKTHWDVDTELMQDILNFYEGNSEPTE